MKQLILVVAALLAGFLGGGASTVLFRHDPEGPSMKVVRAARFELVNQAGQVISMWGSDKGEQVVLAFGKPDATTAVPSQSSPLDTLDDLDRQRAAIGLLGDGSPFVELRSKKGPPRARMYLNEFEKPALLMDDETGVRLALGVEQGDVPSTDDNDWVLNFYPERARMGMSARHDSTGTFVNGFLAVHKDAVKYPR